MTDRVGAETDGGVRPTRIVREAVAVVENEAALEMAVADLRQAGFPKSAVSLLASREAVADKLGTLYERVEELEDNPEAPRQAFVSTREINRREDWVTGSLTVLPTLAVASTVVASAGVVAAAVVGAGAVGAALATVLTGWMDQNHAKQLEEQVERGGILLWVNTPTPEDEAKAVEILKRHATHDVHVHSVPA